MIEPRDEARAFEAAKAPATRNSGLVRASQGKPVFLGTSMVSPFPAAEVVPKRLEQFFSWNAPEPFTLHRHYLDSKEANT